MPAFRCYHCGTTLERASLRCPSCLAPLQPRVIEKAAAIRDILQQVETALWRGDIEADFAAEVTRLCQERIRALIGPQSRSHEGTFAPPPAEDDIPVARLAEDEEPSAPVPAPVPDAPVPVPVPDAPVPVPVPDAPVPVPVPLPVPGQPVPVLAPAPAPVPVPVPVRRPVSPRIARYLGQPEPPLEPPEPSSPSLWDEKVKPFLRDTYLWFLGAFLVVAGSLYMVVTTWSSMSGATRQLVVHGGLLALALGWFALGRLADKRLGLDVAAKVFYGVFLSGGPLLVLVAGQILPEDHALGGGMAAVSLLVFVGLGGVALSRFDRSLAWATSIGYALLCATQLAPPLLKAPDAVLFFRLSAYGASAVFLLATLLPARRLFPGGIRSAHGASWLHLLLLTYALLGLLAHLYVACSVLHVRASETWSAPVAAIVAFVLVELERRVARREPSESHLTAVGFVGVCLAILAVLLGLRDLDDLLVASLGATVVLGMSAREHRRGHLLLASLIASFFAFSLLHRAMPELTHRVRGGLAVWLGYANRAAMPPSYLALKYLIYLAGVAWLAVRCRDLGRRLAWTSTGWLWLMSMGVAGVASFWGHDPRAGLLVLPVASVIALGAGRGLRRVEFLFLACAEVAVAAWFASAHLAWSLEQRVLLFTALGAAWLAGAVVLRRREEGHLLGRALWGSANALQLLLTAALVLVYVTRLTPTSGWALLAYAALGTLLALAGAGPIPWHGAVLALAGAAFTWTRLRWPGDADAVTACAVASGFGFLGLGVVLLKAIRGEERRELFAGPLPMYAVLATTGACLGSGWLAVERGITSRLLWIVAAGAVSYLLAAAERGRRALTYAALFVVGVDLALALRFHSPDSNPAVYGAALAAYALLLALGSSVTALWRDREGVLATWFAPLGPFALSVAAILGVVSLAARVWQLAAPHAALGAGFASWFLWTQLLLVAANAVMAVAPGAWREGKGLAVAMGVLAIVLSVVGALDRAAAPNAAYAFAFALLSGGLVFLAPLAGEATDAVRRGGVVLWALALVVGAVAWPGAATNTEQAGLLAGGVVLSLVAFLLSETGGVGWVYAGFVPLTLALDLCLGRRLLGLEDVHQPLMLLALANVYATMATWTRGSHEGFSESSDRVGGLLTTGTALFGLGLWVAEAVFHPSWFLDRPELHVGSAALLAATAARLALKRPTPRAVESLMLGVGLLAAYLAPVNRLLSGSEVSEFVLPDIELALLAVGGVYALRFARGGEEGTFARAFSAAAAKWNTCFAWVAIGLTRFVLPSEQAELSTPLTMFLTTWYFFRDAMDRERPRLAWVYSGNLFLAILLSWAWQRRVYGQLLPPGTMLPLAAITVLAYALFLLYRSERLLALPEGEFRHRLGREHVRIAHVLAFAVVGMQCAAYLIIDEPAAKLLDYLPPVAGLLLLAGMTHAAVSTDRSYFLTLAQGLGLATWVFVRARTDVLAFAEGYDAIAMIVFGSTALLAGMFTDASRSLRRALAVSAGLWPLVGALYLSLEHATLGSAAGFLLLASVHYALGAAVWRSMGVGYLAGALFNAGLWAFWIDRHQIDPQYYGIPFGLTVIGFAELNRKEFEEAGLGAARSFGLLCIYGSSACQVLVNQDLIYAAVLGVLSLIGVVAGLSREERSYVYFGTAFLVLDVLAQLVRMGLKLNIVVPLAIILLGGAILGLSLWAAARKKRREEEAKRAE